MKAISANLRRDLIPDRGFTLVETVISLSLLFVIWLIAINVVIVSKGSGSLARHKVQAMYVIQRAIEDLRKRPFANIAGSQTTVSIDTKGTPDSSADDLTGTQVVTVTSPSQYYKKAVVELRWAELLPRGRTKTMREYCGTYICNDPQAN